MQVYADLLASRAKNRQQLLLATSVSVGRQSSTNPLDGGPLEEQDEDADEQAERWAGGGKAVAAACANADAVESQASLFTELPGNAAKHRRRTATADDMVSQKFTATRRHCIAKRSHCKQLHENHI